MSRTTLKSLTRILYAGGTIILLVGMLLSTFNKPALASGLASTPEKSSGRAPVKLFALQGTGDNNGNPTGASLRMDGGCTGDCHQITARVCNVGLNSMVETVMVELYFSTSGNPKLGSMISSSPMAPLAAGACQTLSHEPTASGTYIWRVMQESTHPGNDDEPDVWSGTCQVTTICTPEVTKTTPVVTETETPTDTVTPTEAETETATPTEAETETATPTEEETETATPTEAETETATPTEEETETATPTEEETEVVTPTEATTVAPTEATTAAPTEATTAAPTEATTAAPTEATTAAPTEATTAAPTEATTAAPTEATTAAPTEATTAAPTDPPVAPTDPTVAPTDPTTAPTEATAAPTDEVVTELPSETPPSQTEAPKDDDNKEETQVPTMSAPEPQHNNNSSPVLIPVTGVDFSNPGSGSLGGLFTNLGLVVLGLAMILTGINYRLN